MTDLDKLIEAVEAGGELFPSHFPAGFPSKQWAIRAYYGSLDAAKALVDAMLPGCNQVTVDWGPSGCGAIAVWWPNGLSGDCEIVEKGYDVCPARALLSATLKVLRTYRSQVLP